VRPRARFFRSQKRWLAPLVALVVLGASLLPALHHHGAVEAHHACVVCTVGHAPAIAPGALAAAVAPTLADGRVAPAGAHRPDAVGLPRRSSRSPPGA